MEENDYIKALEYAGQLTKPAIRKAMQTLSLKKESKVLDLPCGTGTHASWLLEEYPSTRIYGVDIAEEHIEYAKQKLLKIGMHHYCEFMVGDMNKLEFDNETFDLAWCCDGLWPGPKEIGCIAEQPYDILDQMVRITKKGGKIVILFWSSQKLLPGYPFIEASLNATKSAMIPATSETDPELHFMNTSKWMQKAGLKNIQAKTFVADIRFPFSKHEEEALLMLFNMFWGKSESEVSKEIWRDYKNITNPESGEYILNNEQYTGFLTYTMFTGEVSK